MEEKSKALYSTEWARAPISKQEPNLRMKEEAGHSVERNLAHQLSESIEVDRLVVRRISSNTVCIEGVVKSTGKEVDIQKCLQSLSGIDEIINRLVTRTSNIDAPVTLDK